MITQTLVYERFSSNDYDITISSECNLLQFDFSTVSIWVFNTLISTFHMSITLQIDGTKNTTDYSDSVMGWYNY